MSVVNLAGYKFIDLDGIAELRLTLKEQCEHVRLKGTILLAPEGINLFLAGEPGAIASFKHVLACDSRLADIEFKQSESDSQPFGKMVVKIKREIIAFGLADLRPADDPAPRLAARELKRWLDEQRPVTLLDTRNAFEVAIGTFNSALHLDLRSFRDFARAARNLNPELKDQPIVTFCTGGIRCEKAAPYLMREGFRQVYQLDGGILKYFEQCGDAHFRGKCFVFDERAALDADTNPSPL
jgi:UPF0176 protein